jgi:hypothetical protein
MMEEMRKLIGAVRTLLNKAYYGPVPTLGPRLGKSLHMRVDDIDALGMMVHVHGGSDPRVDTCLLKLRYVNIIHRNDPRQNGPCNSQVLHKSAFA